MHPCRGDFLRNLLCLRGDLHTKYETGHSAFNKHSRGFLKSARGVFKKLFDELHGVFSKVSLGKDIKDRDHLKKVAKD